MEKQFSLAQPTLYSILLHLIVFITYFALTPALKTPIPNIQTPVFLTLLPPHPLNSFSSQPKFSQKHSLKSSNPLKKAISVKTQKESYLLSIRDKIKRAFSLPNHLSQSSYFGQTKLKLIIDNNGDLNTVQFLKEIPNNYKKEILKAVYKSAPFESFPKPLIHNKSLAFILPFKFVKQ